MQSEELSEDELTDTDEESEYDEKDEDIPEEVILAKNFTLKELSKTFQNIVSTKDKCWKLIQTYKGVCQFAKAQRCVRLTSRRYLSYILRYMKGNRQTLFKLLLTRFLQRNRHSNFSMLLLF